MHAGWCAPESTKGAAASVKKVKSKPKDSQSWYNPQLRSAVQAILQLPEGRELISSIEKKHGPFSIVLDYSNPDGFDAYWESGERKVMVNGYKNKTLGKQISSILFELHNAASNDIMAGLMRLASQQQISQAEFVKGFERLEHQNALKTCKLLKKGIGAGIFPHDARWNIHENFEDHYRLQVSSGHSQAIANLYRNAASYGGYLRRYYAYYY
jgi:hypothetical protein